MRSLISVLVGMVLSVASVLDAAAADPAGKPSLAELLDAKAIQGALLPAEGMRVTGQSVLAVYRVFRTRDDDIEVLYGYATSDHRSIYRGFALGAKEVRFELVRTASDTSPLMSVIRNYAAAEAQETYPVRSLQADVTTAPDRHVVAHVAGPCNAPYAAWLELADQQDKPMAEKMIVRRYDPPQPFVVHPGCPLAVAANGLPIKAITRARSLQFSQAVVIGDGGILAFSATDPVVARFDAALKSSFLEAQPSFAVIDFGAQTGADLIAEASRAAAMPGQPNAAILYEQKMWSLIDGHFGKPFKPVDPKRQPAKPAVKP